MKTAIINILAKIGYAKAIQEYQFRNQGKPFKENLEPSFIDSKGQQYYSFHSLNDMPLALLEKLNELQEQAKAKIPGADLDAWIAKVEEVLNSESSNRLTTAAHWLEALKDRRTVLFEPTVLMEIATLLNIREDENPCVYNAALHQEKFKQITSDALKGGALYDFFVQAGLKQYGYSDAITRENLKESLSVVMKKVNEFNSALSRISTLQLLLDESESSLTTI